MAPSPVPGTMAAAPLAAANGQDPARQEREDIDKYVKEHNVEEAVSSVLQALLEAKPNNPRQWLLNKIEQELSDESESLSESDLHKLFAITRRITSEIVPQDTINIVISETLNILNCDRVSLFVLDRKLDMLRLYASNLPIPILVSPGQGIAGSVFNSLEVVNIPDCYKDARFDKSFDKKTGYVTSSMLVVPILDFEGSCVGVIQAINKFPRPGEEPEGREFKEDVAAGLRAVAFKRNDEKILQHLTQHMGIALRNAEVYREAISASERATGLLNTIQSLSQDLGTQSMLLTITMHANKIVSAERSTVFLVDEPNQQLWSVSTDTGQEIRIPKRAGIAGTCCCEGQIINIPDAYKDPRFNQANDKKTGFKTQSILAIPMFDAGAAPRYESGSCETEAHHQHNGEGVIGVIQMINKVSFDGQLESFDESDVEVMELFAKFVGPKLTHSSMLSKGRSHGSSDAAEAHAALGQFKDTHHTPGDPAAQHRHGSFSMDVLGEEEDEEGEED